MKILIMPSSIEQANEIDCDGVILGIKDLSINMPFYIELDDIKKIKNKEIFISLNKNMHSDDLPYLKEVLTKLDNIQGVIFYDVAIPNICNKINHSYELVWNQEHMTNNYYTVNFWLNHNVNYTWVSNDITLKEMQEIKENTKAKLMVTLFGYLPIFASKRHLVKNYLKTFKINDDSKLYFMEKEGKKYPLIDNEIATTVYSDFILNGLREKLILDYDYIVLNSFMIDNFKDVVEIFNQVNIENIDLKEKQLKKIVPNLTKGFFYEETIYKVK